MAVVESKAVFTVPVEAEVSQKVRTYTAPVSIKRRLSRQLAMESGALEFETGNGGLAGNGRVPSLAEGGAPPLC